MTGNQEGRSFPAMRLLACFLLMAGLAGAQLTVPGKGWKLVEKGDGKLEGKRTLGVWQNEGETVIVGAAWDVDLPEPQTLFAFDYGNKSAEYEPPHLPEKAELLENPHLGMKIAFLAKDEEWPGRMEHYWIYGKEGGVFLKVFLKGKSEFPLAQWKVDGPVVDEGGKKRKKLEQFVKKLKELLPPTIRIDGDLKPTAATEAKDEKAAIVVSLKEDGVYEVEGVELDIEELKKEMGKAAKKAGPGGFLKIRAAKGIQFKYVQKVIKAASQVGLTQIAYAAFVEDEKDSDEEE